jgi:hypothetical protein
MVSKDRLFGHQLEFASNVVNARFRPLVAGTKGMSERQKAAEYYTRVVMQVVVSVAAMSGGFAVIMLANDSSAHKGAYTLMGAVLGYWLR